MVKRIITAIVALCVFVPALYFSDTWIFPIIMSACTAIGVWEMIACVGHKKKHYLTIPLCLASLFLPIYIRACGDDLTQILGGAMILIIAVVLYIFTVAVFANKTLPVEEAGLLFMSFVYINLAFSSAVYIRDFAENGQFLLVMPFIVAWITDTFAYFSGRFFGKHKLIPAVSPKKTVEGAIGGTIFGAISIFVFAFVIERFLDPDGTIGANYIAFAVCGLILPIVGQIGDLIMSVIKRRYNIKDYGNFFPGHGGMLDRFDSALSNLLVMAVICSFTQLLPIIQ